MSAVQAMAVGSGAFFFLSYLPPCPQPLLSLQTPQLLALSSPRHPRKLGAMFVLDLSAGFLLTSSEESTIKALTVNEIVDG